MRSSFLVALFVFVLSSCNADKNSASKKKTEDSSIDSVPIPVKVPSPSPSQSPEIPPGQPISQDPLVSQAWHLSNTGQTSFSLSGGKSGIDLNLESVTVSGAGIWVAVSDNGVEKNHEDLRKNLSLQLSKNYSLTTPNWTGDPVPTGSAHGTAVSGIIAAEAGNSKGSQGIAYNATLAALKYLGSSYSISKEVDQANGNYDIFNYSYGGYSCHFDNSSPTYIAQLEYGVKTLRTGLGAIYVKAAGNEYYSHQSDCDSSIPAEEESYYLGNANLEEVHSYPWMIVTGAINANGISSSYSTPGSSLWISAPGGEYGVNAPGIVTSDFSGCDKGYSVSSSTKNDFDKGSALNANCNYTSTMNGTSSSTPMTSGAIALLLQVNPNLSWRDVKYILAVTAIKIDSTRVNMSHPGGSDLTGHQYDRGWVRNSAGHDFHNWYGFGLVDVGAAVNMASGYISALGAFSEIDKSSISNLGLAIPDNSAVGIESSLSFSTSKIIESVQIKLNINHTWIGDLGIELTSPSGTISTLMNINSGVRVENILDEVLLSNAFYGETSLGTWKIKVIDGGANDLGTLNKWSLKIYGH